MADLHPEVLALIEAGPTAEEWEHWGEHGNFVPFARRIALRAVELDRGECAKVCDALEALDDTVEEHKINGPRYTPEDCANEIRARGKP